MLARHRAWRFRHPDFDGEGGLALAPTGEIAMVEEDASVRQAILLLLSTVPGERVMRPAYGCHLHSLIFAPVDDTTAGLAIHYVRQALERWEPRIEILHIDAETHLGAPERLDLILEYRVLATRRIQQLVYSVTFSGEPF